MISFAVYQPYRAAEWRITMKRKNLLAAVLAVVMTLSALTVPASAAATFPDIQLHWAKADIEKMIDAGLFIGYEDGTFKPDMEMTSAMALALCARIAADKETRTQIGADRHEEIEGLTGTTWLEPGQWDGGIQYWFSDEFATCLELGILSYEELEAYIVGEQLNEPLKKAEFSRYLVRAMGLGPVAEGLEYYALTYEDADQVPLELCPYVYLLSLYGVVIGDENNLFQPDSYINRAVSATMLSRALDEMEHQGIKVELPRYFTGTWQGGFVAAVDADAEGATVLELTNELTGDLSLTVPVDVPVYMENRLVERTVLKAGAYVRVCYDTEGVMTELRVIASDELYSMEGILFTMSEDSVVIGGETFAMNVFTQVEAGGVAGDVSVIDYEAGYDSATVVSDGRGNALTVVFHGGLTDAYGILGAVEPGVDGQTIITVASYDGSVQKLTVPAGTPVTATGGLEVDLAGGYVGQHITMRVEIENPVAIHAVEIDVIDKYVQGVLRKADGSVSPGKVTIAAVDGSRVTTYQLSAESVVSYGGAATALDKLPVGSFVTARLEGSVAVEVSAWPGASYTQGTLTRVVYGEPTVLEVTREDGAVVPFEISTAALEELAVVRGGVETGITALRTGDSVTVTVQYNAVARIDAVARTADVTGTVQRIVYIATTAEIEVLRDDGVTAVYTVPFGVSITQDGAIVQITALKVGARVAMVVTDDQVVSMEITQAAATNSRLACTVYLVNSRTSITVLVDDGAGNMTPLDVEIPSDMTVTDTINGGTMSVSRLASGDKLEMWGVYRQDVFVPTTIIRVA